MKKARKVEVPSDRNLTEKEYNDLNDHAFNSSMWQASNYTRSEKQIREKLYEKGYPKDEVTVDFRFGLETKNMVEDAVNRLIDLRIIGDEKLAEDIIRLQLSKGNGLMKAKMSAFQKGVSFDVINEVVESLEEDNLLEDSINEALDKAARQIIRTSSYYREEDKRKRDQKFVQKLVTKGFSFSDIAEWKEEYAHLLEDD